ncbi:hypothetical protein J3F83DRAFT_412920 [Trichoderma novae-zelandiae]
MSTLQHPLGGLVGSWRSTVMDNISSKSRRFDSVPGEQFSPEKSYIFFPFWSLFGLFLSLLCFIFRLVSFCCTSLVGYCHFPCSYSTVLLYLQHKVLALEITSRWNVVR